MCLFSADTEGCFICVQMTAWDRWHLFVDFSQFSSARRFVPDLIRRDDGPVAFFSGVLPRSDLLSTGSRRLKNCDGISLSSSMTTDGADLLIETVAIGRVFLSQPADRHRLFD